MSAKVYVDTMPNAEFVEVGIEWDDDKKRRTVMFFLKPPDARDLVRDIGKALRKIEDAR